MLQLLTDGNLSLKQCQCFGVARKPMFDNLLSVSDISPAHTLMAR
jgi:hypothetical protein